MKLFAPIFAAITLTMAAPAFAQEAPAVVGDWETTMETPMGNFTATMTVVPEGEGYTVAMAEDMPEGMPAMESAISNVAVEGDTIKFDRTLTTEQGPMELQYSFTARGDAIFGEANSAFGAMAITGMRKGE